MISGQKSDSRLWLESWPNRLTPLVDVICIPGAGAGTFAYRSWQRKLPGYCAMHVCQLPGRENRIDEPVVDSLEDAVDQICSAYLEQKSDQRPLILFGHSMGGVMAFELARKLQGMDCGPVAIILSASTPPRPSANKAKLSDEALKQMLVAYDSGNSSVVKNDELFASLAPVLQGDFQLLRGHVVVEESKLTCAEVHLLSGESDPVVSNESVARWKQHFGCSVSQQEFSGGHQFPFQESESDVIGLLTDVVRRVVGSRVS
ncbi:MAG: alpha/beta fold hydrolase [Rhizobiaceae bacterium]|nr:alpha/beta fold hydrolase [Rhizobiaceae bacterium]